MEKIRIFLADDHAVIREGIKLLLNAQNDMEVVGEAGDGKEAWGKIRALNPDVVVLDISMPSLNGAEMAQRLTDTHSRTRVLALSAHEDEAYLALMMNAGASGYVPKRAVAEQLTGAIRAVAAGQTYLDPLMAARMALHHLQVQGSGRAPSAELSEREVQVLTLVAWGRSNKEIAAELHLSVKTVETYKARLMEKLSVSSRTELVRYAFKAGLMRDE